MTIKNKNGVDEGIATAAICKGHKADWCLLRVPVGHRAPKHHDGVQAADRHIECRCPSRRVYRGLTMED